MFMCTCSNDNSSLPPFLLPFQFLQILLPSIFPLPPHPPSLLPLHFLLPFHFFLFPLPPLPPLVTDDTNFKDGQLYRFTADDNQEKGREFQRRHISTIRMEFMNISTNTCRTIAVGWHTACKVHIVKHIYTWHVMGIHMLCVLLWHAVCTYKLLSSCFGLFLSSWTRSIL